MTFASMLFVFVLIAALIVGLLLITGIILIIVGLVNKSRKKYSGKKSPAVCIIAGTVLIALPAVTAAALAVFGISASVKNMFYRPQYDSVPELWRNERVTQSRAKDDIIDALLDTADSGSREAFSRNFTPELQRRADFDDAVTRFLEKYPVGLSQCEKENMSEGDTDSYDYGTTIKNGSVSFTCTLEGKWYSVSVGYCYRNTEDPDKIGVTDFHVMNLEAAAVCYEESSRGIDNLKDIYLLCDIRSSSEVSARLIGGLPYLWTSTDIPTVPEDELRVLVKYGGRLDDPMLSKMLGQPNIGIKHDDSTEYGYFYEILPNGGEPRYAYFQTDSEFGNIVWACICTPYEVDYDHPLFEDSRY